MTATARLAEFIVKTSLDDCPAAAAPLARRAALDTLGAMLAGAGQPAARIVRQAIRAEGGIPLATVVGTSLRTSPTWAALANGVAGHARDFDETSFALAGDPSVPLLAAALASGEAAMADGRSVVTAYVVGFEVSATVGTAVSPSPDTRGWHATSTVGTLGCAAAAARLLGLDVSETRHALGIAASLASGLEESFGSMARPYHAGHASRNGVWAAQLAREGLTASDTALEGPPGHAVTSGATCSIDDALAALGRTWHVVTSPTAVKSHPPYALTQPAIEKFVSCASHVLPREEAEAIASQLAHLDEIPDIRALTARLATTHD